MECRHMSFVVTSKATRQVVREIDRFLKKHG
jgi:phage-related protein